MQTTYYSYIISVRVRPEAAEQVIRMYREQTAPLIADAPGLLALLGLFHRPSGRGLSIRVWDTPANRALTDVPAAAVVDDLARYADLLRGIYTRDPYDVTVFTRAPVDPERSLAPAVARVTTEEFLPDGWDDGIAALRALATETRVDQAGTSGIVLFENRGMCRAILIEVADTRADLNATADAMHEHDLAARRSGYLAKRIEHEIHEVIARY